MKYDWSLFGKPKNVIFKSLNLYLTLHRFVLLIYGEMAKNHLCITDVTKRFAKKCALLYNLGQKC